MIKEPEELGFNTHQFVTFASMIGKESGDDMEKTYYLRSVSQQTQKENAFTKRSDGSL